MSIVGGLVGSHAARLDTEKRNSLSEWAMRNAWGVILIGSVVFWFALGAILIFG